MGDNQEGKIETGIFYKEKDHLYNYRPPLISVLDSEANRYDEEEFSESIEGSEQMFSSNREDMEELKLDFKSAENSSK